MRCRLCLHSRGPTVFLSYSPTSLQRAFLVVPATVDVPHSESDPPKLDDVVLFKSETVPRRLSLRPVPPMVVLDDVPELLLWILVYMRQLHLIPMVNPVALVPVVEPCKLRFSLSVRGVRPRQ